MSISGGISVSNSVSISLRLGLSLTLSIVVPGISVSKSRVGVDSWGGNDSGVSSNGGSSMSIGGSSYNSNIVGMSSGISVSNWESSSDLSDGVSISLRLSLSLTLSIEVPGISVGRGGVSMDSRGVTVGRGSSNHMVGIAKMSNTSIPNMSGIGTVADGPDTNNNTVRVVNTSYNTTMGESRCDLTNGVGVTVSIDSSNGQKDKCESSHLDMAEQSS